MNVVDARHERERREDREAVRKLAEIYAARAARGELDSREWWFETLSDPCRAPVSDAPRRHATNEHGDCPHWCQACRIERLEREGGR